MGIIDAVKGAITGEKADIVRPSSTSGATIGRGERSD